jgi:hypothetical protein
MSKRHALYQEGFLCLFDKQGEMFFRAKTYITCAYFHGGWGLGTTHRELHDAQDRVFNPEGIDPCDDSPQWSPAWMDAAFLHDGNEEIDEFCFIGHFDIEWENKNKWHYSFGSGYMEGPGGVQHVQLADVDEDWEYQYHDSEIFGTINMDKLRVIVD